MNVSQTIPFSGLDQDTVPEAIQEGSYTYALNIRPYDAKEGAKGAVTNIKGNTLVTFSLPAGTNKCRGAHENIADGKVYYFIENSEGNNKILQYDPIENTINTVFSTDIDFSDTITEIDMVDDLLFFIDGIKVQRKINVTKGLKGEQGYTHLYFGDGTINPFVNGATFIVSPSDDLLTYPDIVYTSAGTGTFTEELNLYKDFLVTELATYPTLTVTLIDNLYIRISRAGSTIVRLAFYSSSMYGWAVDYDFYTTPHSEIQYDVIKHPPHFEPQVSLQKDESRTTNNLKGQALQFRYRFIYDDNEKSAWSPVSLIALDETAQGIDILKSEKNYVQIDYSDNGNLYDPYYRNMIKRVEIAFRNGNTGQFKSVKTLEQYELTGQYRFYNDGYYSVIADSEANLNCDAIPFTSNTQAYFKDRLWYANNEVGKDKINVELSLDTDFRHDPPQKLWTIRGRLIYYNTHESANRWQPIYAFGSGDSTTYFFGANHIPDRAVVANKMKQEAPEGGIPVYLAGTQYYAITKQALNWITTSWGTDVYYSEFEIKNVPPGEYVMRCASHLCDSRGRHGDTYNLSDSSLGWQKTSTYLLNIFGGNEADTSDWSITTGEQEYRLTLPDDGTGTGATDYLYDMQEAAATAGKGYNGYIMVADMSYYKDEFLVDDTYAAGLFGYLVDDTAETNTKSNMPGALRAEHQEIVVDTPTLSYVGNAYTDHNGFFWGSVTTNVSTNSFRIAANGSSSLGLRNNTNPFYIGHINNPTALQDAPLRSGDYWLDVFDEVKEVVAPIYNFTNSKSLRTQIVGKVENSAGQAVSGTMVVYTHGGTQEKTDINGAFSLNIYLPAFSLTRFTDKLIIGNTLLSSTLSVDFTGVAGTYDFDTFFYAAPGSGTSVFPITPFEITLPDVLASSLKRGGEYLWGIVYEDRGNRSMLARNITRQYIPFSTEDLHSYFPEKYDPETYLNGQPIINWEISSTPPSWATHYRIVRTKNRQHSRYLQIAVSEVEYISSWDSETSIPTATAWGSGTELLVSLNLETLKYYKDDHPDSLLGYTYQKGDRLRFVKRANGNYYEDYIDVEIKESYGHAILIDFQNTFTEIDAGADPFLAGAIVEIYTPKLQTEENIFFEISESYPIIEDGDSRYHGGQLQDQTALLPAKGVISHGDCYFRSRKTRIASGSVSEQYVEDPNVSDFFESFASDIGRTHYENRDERNQTLTNQICFSGKYIPDTLVNGLCSFEPLSNDTTRKEFGAITKIQPSGNVLLVLHQRDSLSMYVNEKFIQDTNGQQILSLSDEVIGTMRPLAGGFGTVHPESVDTYNGVTYFFDANKGAFVRYSNDGLTPISQYGLTSYTLDKARTHTGKVYGTVDSSTNEYIATFENDETVAYHEPSNRWTTFYSFAPEMYSRSSTQFISFKNGALWRHEQGEVYNNFYGVQYTSKITPVANINPASVKIWTAMSVRSDSLWTAPVIENTEGQESELAAVDYKMKEYEYWASFLRDKNTPLKAYPLFNGEVLRSHALSINLSNSSTVKTVLYWVYVSAVVSSYVKR